RLRDRQADPHRIRVPQRRRWGSDPARAVRWLQTVGSRPGMGCGGPRRVPGDQGGDLERRIRGMTVRSRRRPRRSRSLSLRPCGSVMTLAESDRATGTSGCPVHNFNYTELQKAGTWFEKYDRLRDESPIYRNEFGPGFYTVVNHEGILDLLQ